MSQIDMLADDIRELDGNHNLGAEALAEKLIERGWVLIPERDEDLSEFFDGGVQPTQAGRVQGLINYVARRQAANVPKKLSAYKLNQHVEVLRNGDYVPGIVSSFSQGGTNIHVETERGPVTVQNPTRIRPQV